MWSLSIRHAELADAWIEGQPAARWRSASGHGPSAGASSSGSSLLEVEAGCLLPRHTDSAEETLVVLEGRAEITIGDERAEVAAGSLALVPVEAPHMVRNAGSGRLRFVAVYAGTHVVTRYEEEVQPDGKRERSPVQ